jgi:hypothetical protein
MPRSPTLARRSAVVFAAAAGLAIAGSAVKQAALRGQRRHYEEIGALARHRQLAAQLVRGTVLALRGDSGMAARGQAESAGARARLAEARAALTATPPAAAPGGRRAPSATAQVGTRRPSARRPTRSSPPRHWRARRARAGSRWTRCSPPSARCWR